MTITWLIFLFSVLDLNPQTGTEYVCTPCGQSCDEIVKKDPGKCDHCGMALVKKSEIKFTNLSLDQVCERIKENPNAILLDVRSAEEFKGTSETPSFGHFKNAININVTELEKRMSELTKYKDREILVYCSHSHRSPAASFLLGTKGFTNVKNVEGGVSTFKTGQACLPTEFVFHGQ